MLSEATLGVFALIAALAMLAGWLYQFQLLSHLRSSHSSLWRSMGEPWPLLPTLQKAAMRPLNDMLWWNRVFAPPDEVSRQLVRRFRWAAGVSLTFFLVAFLGMVYMRWRAA